MVIMSDNMFYLEIHSLMDKFPVPQENIHVQVQCTLLLYSMKYKIGCKSVPFHAIQFNIKEHWIYDFVNEIFVRCKVSNIPNINFLMTF